MVRLRGLGKRAELPASFEPTASERISGRVRYCKACKCHILWKDHHCVMVDACVSRSNLLNFALFLLFMAATLWHGCLIALTAVCDHVPVAGGYVLLPRDCSLLNDKFEGDAELVYACGIHLLVLAVPVTAMAGFYLIPGFEDVLRKLEGGAVDL